MWHSICRIDEMFMVCDLLPSLCLVLLPRKKRDSQKLYANYARLKMISLGREGLHILTK